MHIRRHGSRAAFILMASNIKVNNRRDEIEEIEKNIIMTVK